MEFIELFAGIGGFRLGLESSGHKCIWANEWLEKPRRIYKYNFGEMPDGRDIRTIRPEEIPYAPLLCGGFPCATFSVAGQRTGFNEIDIRGTLFFEIMRIAGAKRIPYLFLENVKGLLNHDRGRTFGTILHTLGEYGYDVQWECVNSKNFGVPQNRERVFIIGNLRGNPRPKIFPLGEGNTAVSREEQNYGRNQSGVQEQITGTLDAHYYKGGGSRTFINEDVSLLHKSHGEVREYDNVCPTITAGYGTGGNNVPYIQKAIPVLTPNRQEKRQNGRRFKEDGDPAFTLTAQDRHGIFDGRAIRKLTPLECERLQGLPDNWTKFYDDGKVVADNERYERVGRCVTIPVIKAIGERFHEFY